MSRIKRKSALDLCAAGLSTLCVLHCLLVPLGAAALPVFAHLAESHFVHLVFVLLAAPITLWVIWGVLKGQEGSLVFVGLALTGLAFMLAAVMISGLEAFEMELTLVGATLLGGSHLWRWFRHGVPT